MRALFVALAVYALTDNILTMVPALVPFLYLALILGEPEPGGSDGACRDTDRAAGQRWAARHSWARALAVATWSTLSDAAMKSRFLLAIS